MGIPAPRSATLRKKPGKVKEAAGRPPTTTSRAEGVGDQAKANVKQAGEKVKDAAGTPKDAFR